MNETLFWEAAKGTGSLGSSAVDGRTGADEESAALLVFQPQPLAAFFGRGKWPWRLPSFLPPLPHVQVCAFAFEYKWRPEFDIGLL